MPSAPIEPSLLRSLEFRLIGPHRGGRVVAVDDEFTQVIRADPVRRGLLFAGTETGLYLSFDDGTSWQPFKTNLPVTPIYDFVIKGSDLVVGTHGRSLCILDDLTPLRQVEAEIATAPAHLFAPRPTIRYRVYSRGNGRRTPG